MADHGITNANLIFMRLKEFVCSPIAFGVAICFTAMTSFAAQAQKGVCDLALLEAIQIEKFGPETNTAHTHRFMQVMSKPLQTGQDLEQVTAQYFSDFVAKLLPELIENHRNNKNFLKADGIPEQHMKQVEENFASIDRFILSIQRRLSEKKLLRYVDMIAFSQLLTISRNRKALAELEQLAKTPELLQKRYPDLSLEGLLKKVAEEKQTIAAFWLRIYVCTFDADAVPKGVYRYRNPFPLSTPSLDDTSWFYNQKIFERDILLKLILLPTQKPTGFAAFFATFHLPVSPGYLASSYEVIDNQELASPSTNFDHDVSHYLYTSMKFQNDNPQSYFGNLAALGEDLKNLKIEIQAHKEDPYFLNTLYFVFYFLKFENQIEIPPLLKSVLHETRMVFDHLVYKDPQRDNFSVVLERALKTGVLGTDLRSFVARLAKINFIMAKIQLAKEHSGNSDAYRKGLQDIKAQYQDDLQRIPINLSIPQ